MRVRYRGPEDAIELALSGACLTFPRDEWVDPDTLAADAFVSPEHLAIALGSLGGQWEIDPDEPKRKSKTAPADDQENDR